MSGLYGRFKGYVVRSGPLLYDLRFLIAGFCITGLGVIKLVNSAKHKKAIEHKGGHH